MKADREDPGAMREFVTKYGGDEYFSPKEKAFMKDPNPTEEVRMKYTWRCEGLAVMLWALGYLDQLNFPKSECNVPQTMLRLRRLTKDEFIKGAKLRPIGEILDQADLMYRCDWAVVEAQEKETRLTSELNSDVVFERHYALNWLIGYMNQEWDDISTDT